MQSAWEFYPPPFWYLHIWQSARRAIQCCVHGHWSIDVQDCRLRNHAEENVERIGVSCHLHYVNNHVSILRCYINANGPAKDWSNLHSGTNDLSDFFTSAKYRTKYWLFMLQDRYSLESKSHSWFSWCHFPKASHWESDCPHQWSLRCLLVRTPTTASPGRTAAGDGMSVR